MDRKQNRAVFDLGMYEGEDTAYYLRRGFKVLAVDANPDMVGHAKTKFSQQLATGQLTILNVAITDRDGEEVEFHLSNDPTWSSLKKSLSNREYLYRQTIKIGTRTLPSLIHDYGVPYYCKIALEGYDAVALRTLMQVEQLPLFVSAATECLSEFENGTDERALETLNILYELGYRQFKIVDKKTLNILEPNVRFYDTLVPSNVLAWILETVNILYELGYRELKPGYQKTHHILEPNVRFCRSLLPSSVLPLIRMRWVERQQRHLLKSKFDYVFPPESAGPFGDDLDSKWLAYDTAKKTLLFHRQDYMSSPRAVNYGFWCDWHAKL